MLPYRIEARSYPDDVLRDMAVHRDYGILVPMGGAPRTMEQVPGPRVMRPGDSIHMVMNTVESNGSITRVEVEQILVVSRSSAGRLLEGLVQEGKLKKVGSGRSSAYAVMA